MFTIVPVAQAKAASSTDSSVVTTGVIPITVICSWAPQPILPATTQVQSEIDPSIEQWRA